MAYPGAPVGYPPAVGGGYPGTTPAPYPSAVGFGMPAPIVAPEVQAWFHAVDTDRSGQIDVRELQACLRNGQGRSFSETCCALMIALFDKDYSGTIDVMEFQQLFTYINQWLASFRAFDRNCSNTIDESELNQALQQMGYRFNPQFIKFLIAKSDPMTKYKVTCDQFIEICVQIQKLTTAFKARDREMRGVITIGYEDFMTVAFI